MSFFLVRCNLRIFLNAEYMVRIRWRAAVVGVLVASLAACSGADITGNGASSEESPLLSFAPPVNGPAWTVFGGDPQHSSVAQIATQDLNRIRWRTPVDMAPQYSAQGFLFVHYGAPVITTKNTVIVPVKRAGVNGYTIEARAGQNGSLLWSLASDYVLPPHHWTPGFNATLTRADRVYAPGAGGRVIYRADADSASSASGSIAFYGDAIYNANSTALDAQVFINTPITADSQGNIYFGYVAAAGNPAAVTSGLARIAADGSGTWVAAAAMSGDSAMKKVATNSAPALSADEKTLYVVVNSLDAGSTTATASGYIVALDTATLVTKASTSLIDPQSSGPANIADDSTASPTIGPDGDVYIGVLESATNAHNGRGWLLHYNASLSQTKVPGSYGWDNTPSIVHTSMVPTYTGASRYLVMTSYNNEARLGAGDAMNKLAILDPNASQSDFISGIPVMKEVLTVPGVTPDPNYPGGVVEWATNVAAVDPFTKSVLVNSNDGWLYRWDLTTNALSQKVRLTSGLGEAYTPTVIGADGTVYTINNAVLFAVGK